MKLSLRSLLLSAFALAGPGLFAAEPAKPAELRLDYATYSPSSLVLKKFGWLEEDLKADGVAVRWLFSAGSNKANELVSSNSSDFGSTAGSAALIARTNGVPLRTIYVSSRPEWSQILVKGDSPLKTVADLRGKKIAATRGTDPFTLTLRGLRDAGLTQKDVELVPLQHSDGYLAWQRGNVDAWAALDPFLATALLKDGARPLFANVEYNSFSVLNVREAFLAEYPTYVHRVIKAYEKARLWIIAHPDEAAAILAEAAKIDVAIARNQLTQRTGLDPADGVGIPGPKLRAALEGVIPILVGEKIAKAGSDPAKSLAELIDPAPATAALATK
ncbi:MAG TPA: aliphatic sulfonate ABC transporter substrate-binding protein [Opitutaceae bacterium]|nr:aliphatic sulfonate ABC transporter substrate-binding protein [Opitutaceae bacterium]